jgi:succinylglutamate desuccinylase
MKRVTTKTGSASGKTVAIFGGVHGNEQVGVDAVRWAAANITPERGTVHFVEANPEAIDKNVRLTDKNLNRCFLRDNEGSTLEDMRARELMSLLDGCDALLDIHSSNSKEAIPFIICEADGLLLARSLDFPIISTGWDALEPGGADGYMFNQGKPGICLECGSVFDAEQQAARARQSILRFLEHFELINPSVGSGMRSQKLIKVYKVGHAETGHVEFSKDYADFEQLVEGEVFAKDGDVEYRAEAGDCIIFPRPNAKPGAEAFILGKEVQK